MRDALYFDRAMALSMPHLTVKSAKEHYHLANLSITDVKISRFMYKERRVLYRRYVYGRVSSSLFLLDI